MGSITKTTFQLINQSIFLTRKKLQKLKERARYTKIQLDFFPGGKYKLTEVVLK